MKIQSENCVINDFIFYFQEAALNYLSSCIDQVNSFGDILQLVIVELIYKVINNFLFVKSSEKLKFLKISVFKHD